MNLTNRVEKLEERANVGGVRFVARYPPKMSREEWAAHAREMRRRDPNFFTLDLDAAEVLDIAISSPATATTPAAIES